MAVKRNFPSSQYNCNKSKVFVDSSNKDYSGSYANNTQLTLFGPANNTSRNESDDLSCIKNSLVNYNGFDYQLIPVEIEKDAEIGLVVGQIGGEDWVFIDEILPNGMIDTHGTLKEGDYLIQAGAYSLQRTDIPTALLLIERAYDEGKKTVSFVAARQQTPNTTKIQTETSKEKPVPSYEQAHRESRARSFVEYENEEEEEDEQHKSSSYSEDKDVKDTAF